MFSRLRRFAGVLLALALLPAAGGAAPCVDHADAVHHVEGSAFDTETNAHEAGAHGLDRALVGDVQAQGDVHHNHVRSLTTNHALSHGDAGHFEPSVFSSRDGKAALAELRVAAAHVAPDGCCPPAGTSGECGHAMGCSVMTATPNQRANAPGQTIARVIAAEGVQQSPGPSRAPEVPPPRS